MGRGRMEAMGRALGPGRTDSEEAIGRGAGVRSGRGLLMVAGKEAGQGTGALCGALAGWEEGRLWRLVEGLLVWGGTPCPLVHL